MPSKLCANDDDNAMGMYNDGARRMIQICNFVVELETSEPVCSFFSSHHVTITWFPSCLPLFKRREPLANENRHHETWEQNSVAKCEFFCESNETRQPARKRAFFGDQRDEVEFNFCSSFDSITRRTFPVLKMQSLSYVIQFLEFMWGGKSCMHAFLNAPLSRLIIFMHGESFAILRAERNRR